MAKAMRAGVRVALCLLFMALAACARTPPEARLRETVSGLQAAIEGRDVSALREVMAEDFVGPDGLDRDGARRMAQGAFLRYRDVGVTIGPLEVELRAEQATVRFTAALTGGSGALPDSGQVYDVETGWREVDGDWRLVNASWKPRL
ncbi:nuclear transport factor 2 family protein [Lysobacter solisilvae (ex Woo and Kim 2020)]|uniref:Nuclear transport factor 2 family protein n=1 Tax=Agrilutibacter terrestris TaxID=2865112 RepID=A0A7H0FXH1_9GAMM|nr:nuclear transport factor 2 family protein [Lysobacter terrestris]QNP40737.1 nuclear transport factor 2 family protein [Lysobacter terrestris]